MGPGEGQWSAARLVVVLLVVWLASSTSAARAAATPWMPFALVDGEVQVEASVNGERGRVVLDTGVHHNLVAPRFHQPLQGVLRQGGDFEQLWVGAAYKDVDRFHGVPVEVFGSTFELRDVAFMAPGAGDALARIGVGLLERQLIQFDFPHRRVRFITRDSLDLRALANVRTRVRYRGGFVVAKVDIAGERTPWLRVATGYPGGVYVSGRRAWRRDWRQRWRQVAPLQVAGRLVDSSVHLAPELTVGPHVLADIPVDLPGRKDDYHWLAGKLLRYHRRGGEGLLGTDVLRHFVVTMDLRDGHLHLALPDDS